MAEEQWVQIDTMFYRFSDVVYFGIQYDELHEVDRFPVRIRDQPETKYVTEETYRELSEYVRPNLLGSAAVKRPKPQDRETPESLTSKKRK